MRFLAPIFILSAAVCWPAYSAGQSDAQPSASALISPTEVFKPNPQSKRAIDYTNWNEVLDQAVLPMGPSTRIWKRKPKTTGTNIDHPVHSPYRMEGNKVLYSYFESDVSMALKTYVDGFVSIANQVDITTLPRDEQLAFWINLHNSLVLREIDEHYPGPRKNIFEIKPVSDSEQKLHDAPLVQIKGVSLSLRDIREKIVFPHWKSPDVPFAFHLGNAGGPSMHSAAYATPDLKKQIAENASEYVNSLRGYEGGKIGPYFVEIAPWYYPDFETDLEAYFLKRMEPTVYSEFLERGANKVRRSDNNPADLTRGHGKTVTIGASIYSSISTDPGALDFATSFFRERRRKIAILQRQGRWRRSVVVIEDTDTEEVAVETPTP